MLAMERAGETVIDRGNSSVVDCDFNGLPTQVKTASWKRGVVNSTHHVDGKPNQPYTDTDGIDQMVAVLIVESQDRFYLMHAIQPLHKLVEHGVFGTEGKKGKTTMTIPWGMFGEWITGEKLRQSDTWLSGGEYGWRKPILISPDEYLSIDVLHEVAHKARKPECCPL